MVVRQRTRAIWNELKIQSAKTPPAEDILPPTLRRGDDVSQGSRIDEFDGIRVYRKLWEQRLSRPVLNPIGQTLDPDDDLSCRVRVCRCYVTLRTHSNSSKVDDVLARIYCRDRIGSTRRSRDPAIDRLGGDIVHHPISASDSRQRWVIWRIPRSIVQRRDGLDPDYVNVSPLTGIEGPKCVPVTIPSDGSR